MGDVVNLAVERARKTTSAKAPIVLSEHAKIALLLRLHSLVEEVGAWWRIEAAPGEIPKMTDLTIAGPDGQLVTLSVGIDVEREAATYA